MDESTDTTVTQLINLPDKVLLLWLGLTASVISLVVSYMMFQSNQRVLLDNDVRMQDTIQKLADTQIQQALDINTLTVKLDIVVDNMSSGI